MSASSIRAGAAFIEIFIKDQVTTGLKKINKSLLGFSAKAGLAGAAVGAGGLAILKPLIAAGSEFAEFDRRLRAAGAASELTKVQMTALGEELKRVSVQRGTGLIDLADEAVELARALGKVDPSQLADLADVVAQLAKASGGTLASARTGILSTIGAFGLETSQAKDVANLLVKGANIAQADLSDFVFTLKTLAPVAKTAGISLQTTIALASGLSTIGIKGEEAGTQLRRLAVDVTANTAELEKAFNIKIPKGTTFLGVLELLNKATEFDDVTTRLSKFNKAFGLLGITSALGIGTTAEKVKEFQKAFVDVSGELQKQFDLIQSGLGGGFDRVSASFTVLKVTIGGALEGLFSKFAEAIQAVSDVLSPFIEKNKELVEVLLLVGIGAVGAGAALGVMAVSSIGLSLAVYTLNVALGILAGLLGVLFSPVGAIILAIVALDVGVVALGVAFLALTKTGNMVAKAMGQSLVAAFRAVKKVVGEILATVGLTMEGISLAIKNSDLEGAAKIAFLGLKIVVLQALQFTVKTVTSGLKGILNLVGLHGSYVESIVTNVVSSITNLISLVSLGVVEALSFVDHLLEAIEKKIGNLGNLLTGVALSGALGPLAQTLAANAAAGKPKGGPVPQSALEKLLEANQKKLKELIDAQRAKLGIPDPNTGKPLPDASDAGLGGGPPTEIEKKIQGMVSSSFDSTRGLIKGRGNAASESLKSIAGSTKEMADILRNGTINIRTPVEAAREAADKKAARASRAINLRDAVVGDGQLGPFQAIKKGENTLTVERERRLREAIGRREKKEQERKDLFQAQQELKQDIRENVRGLPSPGEIAKRRRERLDQEKKDRAFRFESNRPFNQKANVVTNEELVDLVNVAKEELALRKAELNKDLPVPEKKSAIETAEDAIKAADAAIKASIEKDATKAKSAIEAADAAIEQAAERSERLQEQVIQNLKSQTKVLERIADKEGPVFV